VTAPAPEWGLGDGPDQHIETLHYALSEEAGDRAGWQRALEITLRGYREPAGSAAVGLRFDTDGELPYPLTISVAPQSDGALRLRCDYRRSQFAPEMVAQFARHLASVHQRLGQAPEAEVPPFDEEELARIVALGRPPVPLVSTPDTLPGALRRVVDATPDAIALCDGEVELSYRELDARADRLASGLRAFGVVDGDRVGICLDRSAELVVTLLGVLKAGATYVPTDPAYPSERLAFTADDADLRVVVTRLPEFPKADRWRAATPDEVLAAAGDPVVSTVTPADPAYVIYTSGSTGRPKGVVVPHRNVLSLIDATRHEYRLGCDDVWTLFHSSAFDFSVWEIWGALLTGGRLVVVPYFVSRDPEQFRDLLVAQRVTVLSQTPSAFAQLLDVAHAEVATRLVVFGGEPLDTRMLLPWFDQHPETDCRMVNMFGITETTVHVTAQTVTRELAEAATRSVGQALPGWQVYVLDPDGRLVPPGVPGEIYVGGAGVAARYLNREDLTAARFLPDPFTGGRMYRSGDRGRLRPDGALDHLGRLDSQVKIRGFRIELDEIRSVLLAEPEVLAAAVVVGRDDPADAASARIDAYVVLSGGDTSAIRKRAAGILPDYMVPATVTELAALPLTTNGKLDVSKLPAPRLAGDTVVDGDDDELTSRLRTVWSEVLGVPVGPEDSFFELGGNSLLAVRINATMRDRGWPTVRLRDLYQTPTIRALVATMAEVSTPDT
jgi:amino acid adenylation domain-containing protein